MNTERGFHDYLRRPTRRRLARVVRDYHPLVWETALRVTGRSDVAEDVVQEVFLDLLLHPPSVESVTSARGYLVWKVLGRVTNLRRAERRRSARERRGSALARSDNLSFEDQEALRDAVQSLPLDLRTAVEMRYFGELSNREIAGALDLSEGAVEKRLHRARESLRSRLAHLTCMPLFLGRPRSWAVKSAPASLLPSLLRVVTHGKALSAASAVNRGATVALNKTSIGAIVAGVCLLGVAGWSLLQVQQRAPVSERDNGDLELEGTAAVTASEPPPMEIPRSAEEAEVIASTEPPFAAIHGRLFDPEDLPFAGATVLAVAEISQEESERLRGLGFASVDPGPVELEAITDDEGRFRFARLLPTLQRVYVLGARAVVCWPPAARLEPGEEREVDPDLCRACSLSGTITDAATGFALYPAQIVLRGDAAHSLREARTGDDYVFSADPSGRYSTGPGLVINRARDTDPLRVVATAPGYAAKLLRIRSDAFREREATLDFALEPEYRALLRVRDPDGRPIGGARVISQVTPWRVSLFSDASYTDVSGALQMSGLGPHRYSFSVSHEGYRSELFALGENRPREMVVQVVLPTQAEAAVVFGRIVFDDAIPEGSRDASPLYIWIEHVAESDRVRRYFASVDKKASSFPGWSGAPRPERGVRNGSDPG